MWCSPAFRGSFSLENHGFQRWGFPHRYPRDPQNICLAGFWRSHRPWSRKKINPPEQRTSSKSWKIQDFFGVTELLCSSLFLFKKWCKSRIVLSPPMQHLLWSCSSNDVMILKNLARTFLQPQFLPLIDQRKLRVSLPNKIKKQHHNFNV